MILKTISKLLTARAYAFWCLIFGISILYAMNYFPLNIKSFHDVCVVGKKIEKYEHKYVIEDIYHFRLKDMKSNRVFDYDGSQELFNQKNIGDCFGFKINENMIQNNKTSFEVFIQGLFPVVVASTFIAIAIFYAIFPFDSSSKYE